MPRVSPSLVALRQRRTILFAEATFSTVETLRTFYTYTVYKCTTDAYFAFAKEKALVPNRGSVDPVTRWRPRGGREFLFK